MENLSLELERMPHCAKAMARIDAWLNQSIIDRPPVRFGYHNEAYNAANTDQTRWNSLRERWFDAEYQVDLFLKSINHRTFKAETFPFYWPNLGPEIYPAFFGIDLEFGEVTSWAKPVIEDIEDPAQRNIPCFDPHNPYYRILMNMTQLAWKSVREKHLSAFPAGLQESTVLPAGATLRNSVWIF